MHNEADPHAGRCLRHQSSRFTRNFNFQGSLIPPAMLAAGFSFAALKGEKADGNDFVNKALTNGAVAVLSERTPPPGFEAAWIKARK